MVRNVLSYGFIFPGNKHHFAAMGVKVSTENRKPPPKFSLVKIGGENKSHSKIYSQLQQFHKGKLSRLSEVSMYYLLSGANFSKQKRHTAKKDDDWSGECYCASELILICQNCQHSVLFEGKQNTSVLFLLQLKAMCKTLRSSDLYLLFTRECRGEKSSFSSK